MLDDRERWLSVGYRFSLVLSREVTEDESAILQDVGCAGAVFTTDTLPTNPDVIVTKMDFDDTISPSLADAIESALQAVKNVPELTVPGLTVPAQPAGPAPEEPDKVIEGTVVQDQEAGAEPVAKKPPVKKASTRRPPAKKAGAGKAARGNGTAAQNGSSSADQTAEPAGIGAGSD